MFCFVRGLPLYQSPLALLVLLLLALGGCSKSLGQVTGRVTYQGQPAEGVHIVLRSLEKPEIVCRAVSVADGVFHVDYGTWEGIPPGPCRIELTHHSRLDGRPMPSDEEGAALLAAGKTLTQQVVFIRDIVAGPNELQLEILDGQRMNGPTE